MNLRLLTVLIFAVCAGCNQTKEGSSNGEFDAEKWKVQRGDEFPYRDEMLIDLVHHHHLKGLKLDTVLQILGTPTRTDSLTLFYKISEQNIGVLPYQVKTLIIKLHPDSTVNTMRIHP